jgi:sarcosine oxidase subunit alpha
VLAPLVEGELATGALPHLSVASGRICGVPMRLARLSFTGELGYEINVPADYGPAVWDAVHDAGRRFGITPYGTEAMHVLRAEKGYIIVGQETDGTVTPDDAGLGWAVGKGKADFVGSRALMRPAMLAADRKQLVGLVTTDPATVLEEGATTLGRSIALALVAGGRSRHGETLHVAMPGGDIAVQVTSPVFYDPHGARLHA